MAWQGVWFEHESYEGRARSPEYLRVLAPPIVYPYAQAFVSEEEARLKRSPDPSSIFRDGTRLQVFYSINHDGGESGNEHQGCRILRWLFEHFVPDATNSLSARFSEIPVVIHESDPVKAAALANALTLLRFLAAHEDQAIAKFCIQPWSSFHDHPILAAEEYERRVLEFLGGEIFYPPEVTLFDILERNDLRAHRRLAPCCEEQVGFILPLLDWIDDCRPETAAGRNELILQLKSSLADEAKYWRRHRRLAPVGQV